MKSNLKKLFQHYSRFAAFKRGRLEMMFLIAIAILVLTALYVPAWLNIRQVSNIPQIATLIQHVSKKPRPKVIIKSSTLQHSKTQAKIAVASSQTTSQTAKPATTQSEPKAKLASALKPVTADNQKTCQILQSQASQAISELIKTGSLPVENLLSRLLGKNHTQQSGAASQKARQTYAAYLKKLESAGCKFEVLQFGNIDL